jgi:ABC-2 type transport system ATP-binding protein
MTAAVDVVGLEKRYGTRVAVAGISLRIEPGEIFGLLGPNGAGKTTTVEILEGYRNADAGAVRVLGLDPAADAAALRGQIGIMLQEGGLYPGVTPRELLRLFAAFYDEADDPEELLAAVGLADAGGTMIRRLSGGQAQRVSLAAALVGRPRVLFLDEPTAGMDPRARADTWDLVRARRDAGATVVLTTHYMDEAEQLCDRLAIIDRGRIVAAGTPQEVTRAATEPAVRFSVDGVLDTAAASAAVGAPVTAGDGAGEYRVLAAPSPALVAALATWVADADLQITELRTGSASLEEVFLRLTEEPEPAPEPARSRTRSPR